MLSYITGGKYAESLSDETARAFERLWMGKADAGVLRGSGSQNGPLLEREGRDELKDSLEKVLVASVDAIRILQQAMDSEPVYSSETLVSWKKDEKGYGNDVVRYWQEKYGGEVERNGKVVNLNEESFRDSLAHIEPPNRYWFAAFAAVPEIVKRGKTIVLENNWKGRGYDTETIVAPIRLEKNENIPKVIGVVVVNHYKDGTSRAYLHRVLGKNILQQIQTRLDTGLAGGLNGKNNSQSSFTIAPDSESVKGTEFELTEDTPSMAEVRRKYEGTDQWMKAPNGNQTNLSERQWLQVRTPEFKKWFGDWEDDPEHASKVVDGNGEHLVV